MRSSQGSHFFVQVTWNILLSKLWNVCSVTHFQWRFLNSSGFPQPLSRFDMIVLCKKRSENGYLRRHEMHTIDQYYTASTTLPRNKPGLYSINLYPHLNNITIVFTSIMIRYNFHSEGDTNLPFSEHTKCPTIQKRLWKIDWVTERSKQFCADYVQLSLWNSKRIVTEGVVSLWRKTIIVWVVDLWGLSMGPPTKALGEYADASSWCQEFHSTFCIRDSQEKTNRKFERD